MNHEGRGAGAKGAIARAVLAFVSFLLGKGGFICLPPALHEHGDVSLARAEGSPVRPGCDDEQVIC